MSENKEIIRKSQTVIVWPSTAEEKQAKLDKAIQIMEKQKVWECLTVGNYRAVVKMPVDESRNILWSWDFQEDMQTANIAIDRIEAWTKKKFKKSIRKNRTINDETKEWTLYLKLYVERFR